MKAEKVHGARKWTALGAVALGVCGGLAGNARAEVAEVVRYTPANVAVTNVVELAKLGGGGYRLAIAKGEVEPFAFPRIEVSSPLVRAKKGEPGYFVVGDGRYGTFRLDDAEFRAAPRFSPLPLSGMKTPRGTWMVVVRSLELESDSTMTIAKGVYSLVQRFDFKHWSSKKGLYAYEDIVIDFLPMPEGRDSYADIARRYREEQLAKGRVRPLAERAKESETLKYSAESIFVRVKHGWKALNTETEQKKKWEHQSPSNEPPIHVNLTFADYEDIMRRMKAAGIDKAEMCSVGGTAGGFDGRFPDVLPIPEEFGGADGIRHANAYGRSLGYQMTVHFATTAMFECSRNWNVDDICHKQDGSLLTSGIVAGGRTHRLCPKVYKEKFLEKSWQDFVDLGFRGTMHVDVISIIYPYQCFNPLHPLNARESARCLSEVARHSRKVFGGFGSEGGRDWIAPDLDFALYTCWYPALGMASKAVDRLVPLWQLVYHGIILSNPFYATIDAYYERSGKNYSDSMQRFTYLDNAATRILKLHEFGGRPIFYYTRYEDIAPVKQAYEDYKKLSHLQYFYMDDHRELAPGVFLTRYSNGEEFVTNYSSEPYAYRGRSVKPMGNELFPGACEK